MRPNRYPSEVPVDRPLEAASRRKRQLAGVGRTSVDSLVLSSTRPTWTAAGGDITARMALVPRTLEARGLDATPPMQARLAKAGDRRAVEILDVILRDEVGHVAVGNRRHRWLCERDGLDPVRHDAVLTAQYGAPRLRPPFNHDAHRAGGFTEAEIAALGDG